MLAALAGAVALLVALLLLPGTPGRPTPTFAQVEAAMRSVKTATWIETTAMPHLLQTEPGAAVLFPPARVWARVAPAAIAKEYVYAAGVRPTRRMRHIVSGGRVVEVYYNAKGWINLREVPANDHIFPREANAATFIEDTLQFPKNPLRRAELSTVDRRLTRRETPWRCTRVLLGQRAALRFESAITLTWPAVAGEAPYTSRHERIVWADPSTYRVLRKEDRQTQPAGNTNSLRIIVSDGFRYNKIPPPGVFDIPVTRK